MEKFEEIHAKYERMIHKIIHSLHIYKNKDHYYQTGLIALWEAHQNFDPDKGAFPAYAYSFVKGRILTQLSKENKHEERSVYKESEFFDMIEDEHINEGLAEELLFSYCKDLTKNQRKWVMYTCLHMLTVSEISEVESVSISAVKKWRKGAKDKIKGLVDIQEQEV
ncbi:sigma-70 family RNA polymerase sigma factor [Rossellomorea aquimaris]|uniref:sigma-70 family RNA polymerase sigma factor n=1 Tax=Rossellomorea aquimaris TaxID=189382 RepID=UPI001CD3D214|nr:sigma-70 family RNA polymerase sigma factor [Rossellomorea aquimaris]MCA1058843.1 sigma-70 family RNA polymerase sigma factor [Rossellomorea aquimaris]